MLVDPVKQMTTTSGCAVDDGARLEPKLTYRVFAMDDSGRFSLPATPSVAVVVDHKALRTGRTCIQRRTTLQMQVGAQRRSMVWPEVVRAGRLDGLAGCLDPGPRTAFDSLRGANANIACTA